METLERVRREAMGVLRPPKLQPVAAWLAENYVVPSTQSAMPGRYEPYPYLLGLCDALDDPNVTEIVFQKSARIGFTEWLKGVIGWTVATSPCAILATQPTFDDSRAFSVDIEQAFEASPTLRGLLSEDADETGRSTMMRRLFAGGSIEYLSANSGRAFRRKHGKLIVADEIDAYPPNPEGSVLDLLRMRSQTYRGRKHLFGGTPSSITARRRNCMRRATSGSMKSSAVVATISSCCGNTCGGMMGSPRLRTSFARTTVALLKSATSPALSGKAAGGRRRRK